MSIVMLQWEPEIRHLCPDVPLILVGTKCDLRNEPRVLNDIKSRSMTPVTDDEVLCCVLLCYCADRGMQTEHRSTQVH